MGGEGLEWDNPHTIDFQLLVRAVGMNNPNLYEIIRVTNTAGFGLPAMFRGKKLEAVALVFGDQIVSITQPVEPWCLEPLYNSLKKNHFTESMLLHEISLLHDVNATDFWRVVRTLSTRVLALEREYGTLVIERYVASGVPTLDALHQALDNQVDTELLRGMYRVSSLIS